MRQIKFRAWHEPGKQMFEWVDFSLNGRNDCIIHVKEGVFTTSKADGNSVILEQFTGLQDSKGKDIYEGDIIGCSPVGQIIYFEPYAAFLIQFGDNDLVALNKDAGIEVIGNIHENSELVK